MVPANTLQQTTPSDNHQDEHTEHDNGMNLGANRLSQASFRIRIHV
jgi:hypothetical protein